MKIVSTFGEVELTMRAAASRLGRKAWEGVGPSVMFQISVGYNVEVTYESLREFHAELGRVLEMHPAKNLAVEAGSLSFRKD